MLIYLISTDLETCFFTMMLKAGSQYFLNLKDKFTDSTCIRQLVIALECFVTLLQKETALPSRKTC